MERDIAFGPKNFGVSDEEAKKLAKKMLDLVGLDEKYLQHSPFELSGGQMRRVAIADGTRSLSIRRTDCWFGS